MHTIHLSIRNVDLLELHDIQLENKICNYKKATTNFRKSTFKGSVRKNKRGLGRKISVFDRY